MKPLKNIMGTALWILGLIGGIVAALSIADPVEAKMTLILTRLSHRQF
jgi:hypothetical protein